MNTDDSSFEVFMDDYLESQEGFSGCSIVGNVGEIIGSMLDLIDNLHTTETQVFGSADKSLLGATSSPEVMKWFRLTALHSLVFKSLLAHSPSDDDIINMARGLMARRAIEATNSENSNESSSEGEGAEQPKDTSKTKPKRTDLN